MAGKRRAKSIKAKVGARLTALREEQALSQAELARRAGTSTSQINAVERGIRAPTIESLAKVASALRVPVREFFEEEPAPKRTRSEKVWYDLMDSLRDRDLEYLCAVRGLLKSFDKAIGKAGPPQQG